MSDLKNKSLFLPKSTLSKAPVGRQTARSSRLSCARVGSGGRGAGPCGEQPAPCCRARRGAERILWNSSIGSASLQLLEGMKHLAYAPVPRNQWRFDIGGWEAGVGRLPKTSSDARESILMAPSARAGAVFIADPHRALGSGVSVLLWVWRGSPRPPGSQ